MKQLPRVRREALTQTRAVLKARVGSVVTASLGDFADCPFALADFRFLGDPVPYVVFEGHTDATGRYGEDLSVVFVVDARDGWPSTRESRLIEECVAAGAGQVADPLGRPRRCHVRGTGGISASASPGPSP